MALTSTAVVLPSTGHLLTRPLADTVPVAPTYAEIAAFATDTTDLPAGFTNYGHSDTEPEFGSDGGESEVKPTWQDPFFDEVVTSEAIDYFILNSCQVGDAEVLADYYGGGTPGDKFFDAPGVSALRQREFLLVMMGRRGAVGLWVPRVSVRKEGPIGVATDEYLTLPLRFTFLSRAGAPRLRWLHNNLVAPTP